MSSYLCVRCSNDTHVFSVEISSWTEYRRFFIWANSRSNADLFRPKASCREFFLGSSVTLGELSPQSLSLLPILLVLLVLPELLFRWICWFICDCRDFWAHFRKFLWSWWSTEPEWTCKGEPALSTSIVSKSIYSWTDCLSVHFTVYFLLRQFHMWKGFCDVFFRMRTKAV